MNPISASVLPYVIVGSLLFVGGTGAVIAWKVQGSRLESLQTKHDALKAEYKAFYTGVEALGKDAQEKADQDKVQREQNLKIIRTEYEKQIPTIQDKAVANYLARNPPVRVRQPAACPGISPVLSSPASQQVDDGTVPQCVPNRKFITDAAVAEAKLASWQRYGVLNRIPVE